MLQEQVQIPPFKKIGYLFGQIDALANPVIRNIFRFQTRNKNHPLRCRAFHLLQDLSGNKLVYKRENVNFPLSVYNSLPDTIYSHTTWHKVAAAETPARLCQIIHCP